MAGFFHGLAFCFFFRVCLFNSECPFPFYELFGIYLSVLALSFLIETYEGLVPFWNLLLRELLKPV